MFRDVIKKLEKTEKEINELKREKAQAEFLLSLVMEKVGELEVDMSGISRLKYENVRLKPNEDNYSLVKISYQKNDS